MKGRKLAYSELELVFLKVRAAWPRRDLYARFQQVFDRPEVSFTNLTSVCKRYGWLTGRSGCFAKGQVPPNKGKKGVCAAGSEKGWFTKGSRSGRAVGLYQPIGAERMGNGGYLQIKVNDDLPMQRRWRGVHLIRWEAVNGPVPQGHVLKCLDGDRTNTDPANWTALPRAVLAHLNARWSGVPFDTASPEMKPTLLAIAQLKHAARAARKTKPMSEHQVEAG